MPPSTPGIFPDTRYFMNEISSHIRPVAATYRADIDGLRAFAVLAVVCYHAFPTLLPSGFVGVDVFFVISGFLITSIIRDGLDAGRFSFAQFYARRVRRILPALLIVLAAVALVGWAVLTDDELEQLGRHVLGATTFSSNFVLWGEAGYFDAASETKPLLHLWSLAIEEQFYLLWPLVMWATWRVQACWLLPVAVIIFLASFGANLYAAFALGDATGDFYSPATRAWELMAGAILALRPIKQTTLPTLLIGIAMLVVAVVAVSSMGIFPGLAALVPTVGAVLIIAGNGKGAVRDRLLANPTAVAVGKISYPLYLWHWPLLSFAGIAWGDDLDWLTRIGLVLLSVVLAGLTFVALESPMRSHRARRVALPLIVLLAAAGGTGWLLQSGSMVRPIGSAYQEFSKASAWDGLWEDPACFSTFGMSPCQMSGADIHTAILGDSHGNHLFPGVAAAFPPGVLSAGTCTPLDGVTMRNTSGAVHPCVTSEYLDRNIALFDEMPDLTTVVISGVWNYVLDFENPERGQYLVSDQAEDTGLNSDRLVFQGVRRTIERLERPGRRLIFVRNSFILDRPIIDFCAKRSEAILDPASIMEDCSIPRQEFEDQRRDEDILVARLAALFPDLRIVDPIDAECDAERCYLIRDGRLLLRDTHHLSQEGSRLVGRLIARAAL